MNIWVGWHELNRLARGRSKVYLYGRSEDWVHKCLKRLKRKPDAIIDREELYHGKKYHDLPICPIESVSISDDVLFVITAGDYDGIVDTLLSKGLIPGKNFVCSPDFRDYRRVVEFHERNFEILISCSDYNDQTRARASRLGGGFYKLNTRTNELTKLISGSYRQFEYLDDMILAVDYVSRELVFHDFEFNRIKSVKLPKPNYCGLAIDAENKVAYIANAGDDTVLVVRGLDKESPDICEMNIFGRKGGGNRESHINDLCFCDNKLIFSYFSRSGNYKYNSFDGGVSHYDLIADTLEGETISNLWKPHSPKIIDGKLWVLDSMRGRLVSGFGDESYEIGGFVRAIDSTEETFIIGQSQDMYLSDRVAQGASVSVDSGVHLFDLDGKALRFIPINTIMNIHDLKVLKNV